MKKLLILSIIAINCYATERINPGAQFDVGFSPKGQSLPLILKCIDSAKKSIHVAAYSFTSKPIANALLKASQHGVDVKVIADLKSNSGKYSATTYLANHNIPVRLDGNYAIFHHKFMIIDGVTLETGSFNYSSSAYNRNAENVLILWNAPKVATIYNKQWQKLWNESQDLAKKY